jgi:hypothetical protein
VGVGVGVGVGSALAVALTVGDDSADGERDVGASSGAVAEQPARVTTAAPIAAVVTRTRVPNDRVTTRTGYG